VPDADGWTPGRVLTRAVGVAAVAAVLALVVGQVLGVPVGLGYVETGSMVPTLNPGDGFVAIPAALTTVSEGDVVVFDAVVVGGGRLTTHRVVGRTPDGYLTKGDANPFADQDGREPPVTDGRVLSEVLQVGGRVVAIPYLGTAVEAVDGLLVGVGRTVAAVPVVGPVLSRNLPVVVLAVGLAAYAVAHLAPGGRTRDRPGGARVRRRRPRGAAAVVVLAGLVAVAAATGAMVVPGGATDYDLVSADLDAPGPRVIPAGGTETTTHEVTAGTLGVVAFLEPTGPRIALDRREVVVGPGGTATVTVTLTAPRENGYYRQGVVEHRYLAVLPVGVLGALYAVHPWLGVLAIDALVLAPFLVVAAILARRAPVPGRDRRRGRDWPFVGRIR
jgi:signal peptidase